MALTPAGAGGRPVRVGLIGANGYGRRHRERIGPAVIDDDPVTLTAERYRTRPIATDDTVFARVTFRRGGPRPALIPPAFVTDQGAGPARVRVVTGINDVLRRAAATGRLPSELDIPWASPESVLRATFA